MAMDLSFLQGPKGAELIRMIEEQQNATADPLVAAAPWDEEVGFQRKTDALDEQYSLGSNTLTSALEQLRLDEREGATRMRRSQMQGRNRLPGAFAGRGLLNSGIYRGGTTGALGQYAQSSTDAWSDFRKGFQRSRTDLNTRLQQLDINRTIGLADVALDAQTRRSAIASLVTAGTA